MNIAEFQMVKAPRYRLIHQEIRGNLKLEVFICEEFARFDAATNTRYHRDYLIGKITRCVERTFWFGTKKTTLYYQKHLLETSSPREFIKLMCDEMNKMRLESAKTRYRKTPGSDKHA